MAYTAPPMFIVTCCAIILHLFAEAEPAYAVNNHILGVLGPTPDYIRCGMFGPLPDYLPHTEHRRERVACTEGNMENGNIVRPTGQVGSYFGSTVGTNRGETAPGSAGSRNAGGETASPFPIVTPETSPYPNTVLPESFAHGENAYDFPGSSRLSGDGGGSARRNVMIIQRGTGEGAARRVPSWPPPPILLVRQPQQRPLPLSWNGGGGRWHFPWGDCPRHLSVVPRRY